MLRDEDKPKDNPQQGDNDDEMTVANGKANTCKYKIINNPDSLYSNLLVASSNIENAKALKVLLNYADKLEESAKTAIEMLKANPEVTLKKIGNASSETFNLYSGLANESVEVYVPVCPILEGSADALAVINGWKTRVRDIQSRLRVRINSLAINAPKISEKEQSNSNAFNNILFFITNDVGEHGEIMINNCRNTKDIKGMMAFVKKLQSVLITFTDDEAYRAKSVPNKRFMANSNLIRWKNVVDSCIYILEHRNEEVV